MESQTIGINDHYMTKTRIMSLCYSCGCYVKKCKWCTSLVSELYIKIKKKKKSWMVANYTRWICPQISILVMSPRLYCLAAHLSSWLFSWCNLHNSHVHTLKSLSITLDDFLSFFSLHFSHLAPFPLIPFLFVLQYFSSCRNI